MKTITENRIKGIEGFYRAPKYDFTDDGSHFIGFEYKGLPLTQHRSSQYGTYLCFRVDYISHNKGFTYEDYSNTSWYHLCDKYNGVTELPELEEIIKDLEVVVAGIKELEEKVKNEVLDYSKVVERAQFEKKFVEEQLVNFKKNFEWWNCKSDWDLRNAKDYFNSLQNTVKRLEKLIANPEADTNIRHTIQCLEKYSYVEVKEDDFYIRELNEILAK